MSLALPIGDGRNFASCCFFDQIFHRFLALAVYQGVTRTFSQASTMFLPVFTEAFRGSKGKNLPDKTWKNVKQSYLKLLINLLCSHVNSRYFNSR